MNEVVINAINQLYSAYRLTGRPLINIKAHQTNYVSASLQKNSQVQFNLVYVRPILIASSYHGRASSRHRPC